MKCSFVLHKVSNLPVCTFIFLWGRFLYFEQFFYESDECKSPIFDDIISCFGADQSERSICTTDWLNKVFENWSEVCFLLTDALYLRLWEFRNFICNFVQQNRKKSSSSTWLSTDSASSPPDATALSAVNHSARWGLALLAAGASPAQVKQEQRLNGDVKHLQLPGWLVTVGLWWLRVRNGWTLVVEG